MITNSEIACYLDKLKSKLIEFYGKRLKAFAVFGSLAAGRYHPEKSDIDLFIILTDPLPSNHKRNKEFMTAEGNLSSSPFSNKISPVIRTVTEIQAGTPLMFDMTEEIEILYDPESILKNALNDLQKRLNRLSAKRVFEGEKWYWILKPDYKWGEKFTI